MRCNNCLLKDPTFTSTKTCKDQQGQSHKNRAATLCARCRDALKKAGVKMREDY